jgi:hypothetical protein
MGKPATVRVRKLTSLVSPMREWAALQSFGEPQFELKEHVMLGLAATLGQEGLDAVTPVFERNLTEILNPSQVCYISVCLCDCFFDGFVFVFVLFCLFAVVAVVVFVFALSISRCRSKRSMLR